MGKGVVFVYKGVGSSRSSDSRSRDGANAGSDASALGETKAGVILQPVVEKPGVDSSPDTS